MTALEARKLAEDEMKAGKTPKYNDLRDWLEIVDSVGELKKIDGVDWNLEMGTLAEIFARESKRRLRRRRFFSTTFPVIRKVSALCLPRTLRSNEWL